MDLNSILFPSEFHPYFNLISILTQFHLSSTLITRNLQMFNFPWKNTRFSLNSTKNSPKNFPRNSSKIFPKNRGWLQNYSPLLSNASTVLTFEYTERPSHFDTRMEVVFHTTSDPLWSGPASTYLNVVTV